MESGFVERVSKYICTRPLRPNRAGKQYANRQRNDDHAEFFDFSHILFLSEIFISN
jgi:hypothetical protein